MGEGRADRRTGGQADRGWQPRHPERSEGPAQSGFELRPPDRQPARPPVCNRCGFEVPVRAWGCKNPCPNCHCVYPLGDCSD